MTRPARQPITVPPPAPDALAYSGGPGEPHQARGDSFLEALDRAALADDRATACLDFAREILALSDGDFLERVAAIVHRAMERADRVNGVHRLEHELADVRDELEHERDCRRRVEDSLYHLMRMHNASVQAGATSKAKPKKPRAPKQTIDRETCLAIANSMKGYR